MDNTNIFLESIDSLKEKLPLTYRFIQPMGSVNSDKGQSYSPPIIEIKFYESNSIEQSGFHRHISKIIRLTAK